MLFNRINRTKALQNSIFYAILWWKWGHNKDWKFWKLNDLHQHKNIMVESDEISEKNYQAILVSICFILTPEKWARIS